MQKLKWIQLAALVTVVLTYKPAFAGEVITPIPPDAGDCALYFLSIPEAPMALEDNLRVQVAKQWFDPRTPVREYYPLKIATRTDFQRFLKENGQDFKTLRENSDLVRDWIGRFILTVWDQWDKVSDTQRDAALAAELADLSPPRKSSEPIPFLGARAKLAAKSHDNLKRMLQRLPEIFPLTQNPQGAVGDLATAVSQEITLHFPTERQSQLQTGHKIGLASPNTIEKLGLIVNTSSHDRLIGRTANSVETRAVGARSPEGKTPYIQHLENEAFLVEESFAKAQGFLLPTFPTAKGLYKFFELWDPAALQDLVDFNRRTFPKEVIDYESLRHWEHANNQSLIVPTNYFRMLTPLRIRLIDYVLTVDDAEILLREALRRQLLHEAENEKYGKYQEYMMDLRTENGARNHISGPLFKALGWRDGLSLHVPIGVPRGALRPF